MTIVTWSEAVGTGQIAAHVFEDFERLDRHWAARLEERYLGLYESLDEDDIELARVAIVGRIGGQWFTAVCLVDGEGDVHDLLGRRTFEDRDEANRIWRSGR